jgi:hypothetical protein
MMLRILCCSIGLMLVSDHGRGQTVELIEQCTEIDSRQLVPAGKVISCARDHTMRCDMSRRRCNPPEQAPAERDYIDFDFIGGSIRNYISGRRGRGMGAKAKFVSNLCVNRFAKAETVIINADFDAVHGSISFKYAPEAENTGSASLVYPNGDIELYRCTVEDKAK